MIINKKVSLDYFLLFFLIGLSGVPYLYSPILKILLTIVLFIVFIIRKKYFNMSFILFFTLLFIITIIQTLEFNFISMNTIIGLFSMVFSAYLIVKVLENEFMDYYIKAMYYISIVSLVFYFTILLLPSFGNFLVYNIAPLFDSLNFAHTTLYKTIIVYNLSHINIFRNSGPFWEPGAFAGYLLIAFMFNYIKQNKKMNKINITLFVTIITTMSTSAILALFIFFIFLYHKLIKNFVLKLFIILGLLMILFVSFTYFDFLGQKIEDQLVTETSKKVLFDKHNTGRIVSMIRDMHDIKGHILIGRGGNFETRYATPSPGEKRILIRTSGLTDFLVKYGLVFFSITLYFLYKSICVYNTNVGQIKSSQIVCFSVFIAILMLSISQVYFNFAVYWSLVFLRYNYVKMM